MGHAWSHRTVLTTETACRHILVSYIVLGRLWVDNLMSIHKIRGLIPWNIRDIFGSFFGYIRCAGTPEIPALPLTKSVLKFRVVC